MLFCHVTSRVETDVHQDLLQKKGGTGFPYLVWMDGDGNVIARQGERSVAGFDKTRKTVTRYVELSAEAAKGDRMAAVEALMAALELGRYDVDEAKAEIAKLGEVPPDKQQVIDGLLLNLEVDVAMRSVRSQEQAVEAGRRFLEMEQAGRVPTGRSAWAFYSAILEVHAADKDATAYEKKLGILKQLLAGEANAARMLKRYEAVLAKLKQAGD